MTYASASKGFKSGGTNDTVADIDTPFSEEQLWSYELGLRSEWLQGRARLNLTWFTSDYADKQITVTTSEICENRCTANAGDGKISGFEADGTLLLADGLDFHFGLGVLDAAWDEITNPTAGVALNSRFARAPDLSFTAGLRYVKALADGGAFKGTLDYAYTDEQNSSPQDGTTLIVPQYDLLNLRLEYGAAAGWTVGLFCRNCLDEAYITGGATWAGATSNTPFPEFKPASFYAFTENGLNDNTAPPGITLVNVGPPRTIGLDLRYDF